MEPVTVILAALAAGASAGVAEVASQSVKDLYAGFKAMIATRLADRPKAEMALDEYTQDPETWEKPLQKSLVEAGVDKDQEVIETAQKLLHLIQPQQVAQGKYNIQIGKAKGVVIGDSASVTQNFGKE